MKETKQIEFIQREIDSSVNIFCSKFAGSEIEKFLGNQGDKTASSDSPMSGEWRTNLMIQSSLLHQTERVLGLKHMTSFEEKSMEDHGKILRRSMESYLKIYNINFDSVQGFEEEGKQKYANWDEVEVGLLGLQNLQEAKKNYLKKFCQRNLQAQLILRLIFINIPEEFLADSLSIVIQIFQDYKNENVELKDEDEIQNFVSLTYSNLAQKIKLSFSNSDMVPKDAEGQYKFQEMIGTWMQTIFLALNGVFENPADRKTPIDDLYSFETFYQSRKLIKFD